jgi:hypothetical protein
MANPKLNKEERAALIITARKAGIDPATLRDENPYALGSPRSITIQGLLRKDFPRIAQALIEKAELPISLGAAAILDGDDLPLTKALADEIATVAPERWAEMQAEKRAEELARFGETMAAKSAARAEQRERVDAQLADLKMRSVQVARGSLQQPG